ncbi:hypothetical protein FQN54_004393 [Arachnomyces sp. PD_36]|nr:hypothetical protein FQN54_004393 [Arachnomyces sp. PD_36]
MPSFYSLTAALALASVASAQCGAGTPDAVVDGGEGAYTATAGGAEVYAGDDYYTAIQTALDSISSGQRIAVLADGSIGTNSVFIDSGKIFEGCGTIDTEAAGDGGSIESTGTSDVSIPYLSMTGAPYFGMLFYGTENLSLGNITMNLSGGMGIRFHRDEAANTNVNMESIYVSGASSHAVETWNIDGLTVGSVTARDVGECGLLLQEVTNAEVGLVDGENVASGNGYATFRMANNNGQLDDGSYEPNIFVDRIVSRGGGRGIFCVSQSGGAVIEEIDLADNENNAILIENCYGVSINSGIVQGGGEVRISAREEFPNTSDITLAIEVNSNVVREDPCGENMVFDITGDASLEIC